MKSIIHQLFSERDLKELRREEPTPLYHQLYLLLRRRILDGTIRQGTQMPTEQELAGAFQVSRITAKRTMDELANEGLVDRRRGRGSYVIHRYEQERMEAPLLGMLERLVNMSAGTEVEILDQGTLVPPANVRADCGLEAGEKMHRLIRIRSSNGRPFAYYVSWTRGDPQVFTPAKLRVRARMELLQESGVKLHHIEQDISAAPAAQEVAQALGMRKGEAVLTLVRRAYDPENQLVDILSCWYHPQRFQYRMNMSMESYAPPSK